MTALLLLANIWFENSIPDPPHVRGERVTGEQRIEIPERQRYFVEVFVSASNDGHAFRLRNGETMLDERRTRATERRLTLMGWVDSPAQLRLQTEAPEYVFNGYRLTRARDFAAFYRPLWFERLRHLTTHALFTGEQDGPLARQRYILQLSERLRHAVQPEVRNEALLGLTRAWYWAGDPARTVELLHQCIREIPEDPIVRQMVTASCAPAKGDLCSQVKPIAWPLDLPDFPPGAPEWAVTQRRLRNRMETITRWWVDQRQAANGELGGGWHGDVTMLRAWGQLAAGLGSPIAAKGIERVANGVWSSGLIQNGYAKEIQRVERSAGLTAETQPWLAALDPANATALERLRNTAACAPNWIAREPDGRFRFLWASFNCRDHDPLPERAGELPENLRAMGPALWYAHLTRDTALSQLIVNWAESQTVKPDSDQEAIVSLFRAAGDLSGDPKWNAAIARDTLKQNQQIADPHRAAAEFERKLSVNFEMYTSEALFTDRVHYALPTSYARLLFGGDPPSGDRYPNFSVTWIPARRDFAREVIEATPIRLSLRFYNFDPQPLIAEFRAWQLEPGVYHWSCQAGGVEVTQKRQRLRVILPPERETACLLRK
ncbi:MAG: hypothetical protein U0Q16_20995 [Bryobacteraceae bacterium]